MKKLGLTLLAAAAILAACGGGGDDSPPVAATSNVTAAVTSSTVAGVTGEPFVFSSGVSDFGTTSATTVTLNSASSFSVSSSEGSASGGLTYGSCIFTVTSSTYPSGHPLAVGGVVRVNPCSITVNTAGLRAEENAVARAVSFVLAGNASQTKSLQVDISDSGTVTVKGVTVGTVTLSPVTGGT
jgi:hypothetical protein